MTIKVTYNVTDIYVSESVSATYINVSYEAPTNGGGGVWGDITGTLSNQLDLQAALDAKVPYSGATANVDLGEFELKAGQIEFDQTPTGVASAGVMRWNDTTGVSETTLKGGSVILRNGVDLVARVVNKVSPNTTLTKAAYQAVRVSGAQGQRLAVAFAQANNDANSADTIGLVTETIATNQEGFIMAVGQLENINTTGSLQGETWVDGDVLYLSPTTAGRITNIKPVAPNHIIVIGYVEYAHAVNGKIYVKVMNGWELGELHDVDTTGAVAGQVLKYNGTIWTPSTDVGITSLNGLTATTQTFSVDDRGTDVNIDSVGTNHKFNFPTASATNRGLVSSADWTTFNNKQNALTNPITGTGVSGQVAYWSGTNTQTGSNNLFWDNTNGRLGIGTNTISGIGGQRVVEVFAISYPTFRVNANNIVNGVFVGNSQANVVVIGSETNHPLLFVTNNTEKGRFTAGGNFLLGQTTDSGQRLQVTGDTLMKGSGNTSGTTALTVQNSDGTNMFRILNDGELRLGNAGGAAPIIYTSDTASGFGFNLNGRDLVFNARHTTQQALNGMFGFTGNTSTVDAGTTQVVNIQRNFEPTSGTAVFNYLQLRATINQTGGANGITRGLYVNPTLTAAADWRSIEWSNNTGWGLYGAGTANNYIGGRLGLGSVSLGDTSLRVSLNLSGSTGPTAIYAEGLITSTSTGASYYLTGARTEAASFTLTHLYHYLTSQGVFGAGSIVTNQYGFFAQSSLTGATNNYGFYGNIASGTGRWNLYMNGTANNFLSGSLGIGSTTLTGYNLRINKDLTGATSAFGVSVGGQILSDVTSTAALYQTSAVTQAATFTLTNLNHFRASQGTFGASSVVTNQHGYFVDASLTGATNNFGFFGNIAAATGRWNFYAAGTALNYFNGNTIMGTLAADSGEKLQVNGTMKVTGASTFGGNMSLSLNQNATTSLVITNTTAGNISQAFLQVVSDSASGSGFFGKRSSTITSYKSIASTDLTIYNGTVAGDISILNDFATGSIKMAAGGSSTAQWTIGSNGDLTAADGENIIVGSTNGTKLGTATSQKIGFWNATPIVQPTTAVAAAAFVANTGTAVNDASTFDGYTMSQVVKALRNAGLLA